MATKLPPANREEQNAAVSGELEAAGASVPLEFDASVSVVDGELELEATTVDRGRLGMSEGRPLGSIRPPTKLHVKARLVREGPEQPRTAAAWRGVAAAWQRCARESSRQLERREKQWLGSKT